MKRGALALLFLLFPNLVIAQELDVSPVRNFIILFVEVALVITIVLIVNHHILERRKSMKISKQINRILLGLIILFTLVIRFAESCRLHQEGILLLIIILTCLLIYFHLPKKEHLNQLFLVFIAIALILTVLHAVDHTKSAQLDGSCLGESNSFLQSPPLDVVVLCLILGLTIVTVLNYGILEKLERWSK